MFKIVIINPFYNPYKKNNRIPRKKPGTKYVFQTFRNPISFIGIDSIKINFFQFFFDLNIQVYSKIHFTHLIDISLTYPDIRFDRNYFIIFINLKP